MNRLTRIVARLSKLADDVAGIGLLAVMALIVVNVLTNGFFHRPILGTYEYVGFLTAAIIGLSVAHCGMKGEHISIDLLISKFREKTQAVIDLITGAISFVFFSLTFWQIGKYAYSMIITGEKSPTTMTPIYPFIYLVALGILMLSLVILVRLREPLRKVIGK